MFTNVDSWRELLADKPIHYTKSQLLQLREKQKASWRKHCNELFESKTFKDSWNFEGSDQYKVATFEPHHKKEGIEYSLEIRDFPLFSFGYHPNVHIDYTQCWTL